MTNALIYDQPDVPSASVLDPSNLYVLVDDATAYPTLETYRMAVSLFLGGSPTVLTPGTSVSLDGTEQFTILVNSADVANKVTIPASQTAFIVNVSDSAANLDVVAEGTASTILTPGQGAYFVWDGSSVHDITLGSSVSVDAVISGASANPVQNQVVKAYIDARSPVRDGDQVVTGSGSASTDASALTAAVSALNTAAAGGTLWIDGSVKINSTHDFTTPVSIRGLSSDASIEVTDSAGKFTWGSAWSAYSDGSATAITATADYANSFVSAAQAFNPGDLVVLFSDDAISDVLPHNAGGEQRPMEIHQVAVDAGSDEYEIFDFVRDALTSTPKVVKADVLTQPGAENRSNVYIGDFSLRMNSAITTAFIFDCRLLNGLKVRNVTFEQSAGAGGPGYFRFHFCTDVDVGFCTCDGLENFDERYLFLVGVVNGFRLHNCKLKKASHIFTTTASHTSGLHRWGTPRNVVVENNLISVDGYDATGLWALDTHSEGWAVCFQNNLIVVSGLRPSNTAITSRARAAIIRNNVIDGSGLHRGIMVRCFDAEVAGNLIRNTWIPIKVADSDEITYDNAMIVGNRIIGGSSLALAAIELEGGDHHHVIHNVIADRGGSAIWSQDGSALVITHNDIHSITDGGGTTAAIAITGTGGDSASDSIISHNTLHDVALKGISVLGAGSGNVITHNSFFDVTGTLITLDTNSARIACNDLSKGPNTYSIDCGSADENEVIITANAMDGYGSGSMGLTGSNAVIILATHKRQNFIDATLGTYTPTNVTTDRTFDADTVAVAELADIVGTLIADLKIQGHIK